MVLECAKTMDGRMESERSRVEANMAGTGVDLGGRWKVKREAMGERWVNRSREQEALLREKMDR